MKKNFIYSLVLLILFGSVYVYRKVNQSKELIHLRGVTMGVVAYNIKYMGASYQIEIDSLLQAFNQSLSHYIPSSALSNFNRQDTFYFTDTFFYPVLVTSKRIFEETDGAFNPAIAPLIDAWGFGKRGFKYIPSEQEIDSLKTIIDFTKIQFDQEKVWKHSSGLKLNLSAIAKGYAVDLIAEFLESKEIVNYLVEIGGEMRVRGQNAKGQNWRVGIRNPNYKQDGNTVPYVLSMPNEVLGENVGIATSGNYENYYVKEGKKYAHTLNPRTGRPVAHQLLSASIISKKSCMEADAYATACMVIGIDKSIEMIESKVNIYGILVYEQEGEIKKYMSKELQKNRQN